MRFRYNTYSNMESLRNPDTSKLNGNCYYIFHLKLHFWNEFIFFLSKFEIMAFFLVRNFKRTRNFLKKMAYKFSNDYSYLFVLVKGLAFNLIPFDGEGVWNIVSQINRSSIDRWYKGWLIKDDQYNFRILVAVETS